MFFSAAAFTGSSAFLGVGTDPELMEKYSNRRKKLKLVYMLFATIINTKCSRNW
jgi:hypothetical protein